MPMEFGGKGASAECACTWQKTIVSLSVFFFPNGLVVRYTVVGKIHV